MNRLANLSGKGKILIAVLAVLVLALIGGLVYNFALKSDDEKDGKGKDSKATVATPIPDEDSVEYHYEQALQARDVTMLEQLMYESELCASEGADGTFTIGVDNGEVSISFIGSGLEDGWEQKIREQNIMTMMSATFAQIKNGSFTGASKNGKVTWSESNVSVITENSSLMSNRNG